MPLLAQSILVTGASRGIGLEFVRQLVKSGPPKVLIAGCRNPRTACDLQDIAKENDFVKIVKLDVENDEDIDAAVKETTGLVGDTGLNLLINNAGVNWKANGGGVRTQTREQLQHHFNVNTTSPIMVTQKFLPLLEKAASNKKSSPLSCTKSASVFVSSIMASQNLALKDGYGTSLHYKCSKTAVNMAGVLMARDLRDCGVLVFSIHPGWVKTDMGGASADLFQEDSVKGMLDVFAGAGEDSMGLLMDYKGDMLPF